VVRRNRSKHSTLRIGSEFPRAFHDLPTSVRCSSGSPCCFLRRRVAKKRRRARPAAVSTILSARNPCRASCEKNIKAKATCLCFQTYAYKFETNSLSGFTIGFWLFGSFFTRNNKGCSLALFDIELYYLFSQCSTSWFTLLKLYEYAYLHTIPMSYQLSMIRIKKIYFFNHLGFFSFTLISPYFTKLYSSLHRKFTLISPQPMHFFI